MRWMATIYFAFYYFISLAQSPQNVTQGKGRGESIWDSTTGLLVVLTIVLLIVISRSWSKNIHKKRDELSQKFKEEKEADKEHSDKQKKA